MGGEAKMTVFDSYGNSSEVYLLLSDAKNERDALCIED